MVSEAKYILDRLCLLSGFCSVCLISYSFHINTPLIENGHSVPFSFLITYIAISLPFLFGGILLSLIFSSYTKQFNSLYAVDLLGASIGCLGTLGALSIFDGISAVLIVSLLATASGLVFSISAKSPRLVLSSSLLAVCLAVVLVINTKNYMDGKPWLRIVWSKGSKIDRPLYERWNSFSWIAVSGDANAHSAFSYAGISKMFHFKQPIRGLNVDIDGSARTTMVGWESDLSKLDVFKYDIANLAYYLRPNADVLIIGAGGGKDLVSALVFDAKHVTGIEINENTLKAVNGQFGDFTGHLNLNVKVSFVNDEARSYISRHKQRYDIIQMPFIDTWAATTNGAYVLTEASLYTVEAWKVFLSHLNEHGIFTVSRWYSPQGRGEILRLIALAAESLREMGIDDPRSHIILLRNLSVSNPDEVGVGTILVSNQSFSAADLNKITNLAKQYDYGQVVSPDFAEDDTVRKISSAAGADALLRAMPINILPPTDDSPFFFNMLKLSRVFDPELKHYLYDANMHAVSILGLVLVISLAATYLCIYLPLRFTRNAINSESMQPLACFFLLIGITYMFVEISLIQRLIVFLGHPVYGISVVVFFLLLSSGLGSYFSKRFALFFKQQYWPSLIPIIMVLAIIGALMPPITTTFSQNETLIRIIISAALVSVAGFFMGMAFPVGLTLAVKDNEELVPWYWGINGAGSVLGSVFAVFISLNWGISALYWSAVVGYLGALAALVIAAKKESKMSLPDNNKNAV